LRGRRRDELIPDLRVVSFGRSANLYFRAEASRIVFIALLGAGLSDERLREILVRRDQEAEL
jgi:plasmid stabilization system protein ParE